MDAQKLYIRPNEPDAWIETQDNLGGTSEITYVYVDTAPDGFTNPDDTIQVQVTTSLGPYGYIALKVQMLDNSIITLWDAAGNGVSPTTHDSGIQVVPDGARMFWWEPGWTWTSHTYNTQMKFRRFIP